MKKYLKLLDDIIVDFLTDCKSLRYQLIILALCLNIYFFKHGASDGVMITSLALLTAVYAFFFASKAKQAEIENQSNLNGDRNPDV